MLEFLALGCVFIGLLAGIALYYAILIGVCAFMISCLLKAASKTRARVAAWRMRRFFATKPLQLTKV